MDVGEGRPKIAHTLMYLIPALDHANTLFVPAIETFVNYDWIL